MTDFEKPNWDGGHPPPDARVGLHATPSNSVECKHRKGWLVDCYECGRQGHGDGLLSNNAVRVRLEMLEHAVFIKVERDSPRLVHDDVPVERAMRPVLRGSRWRRKASGVEHVVVCDEIDPVDWNARYEWVSDPQPERAAFRLITPHRDYAPGNGKFDSEPVSRAMFEIDPIFSGFRDTTPAEKDEDESAALHYASRGMLKPNDTGVIRADEGVTLQPGEYDVAEIDPEEEASHVHVGTRFTRLEPLTANSIGGFGPSFDIPLPGGVVMVTAVRRVEAQLYGVWCARDGDPGFWRGDGTGKGDLRTTREDAERRAGNLNREQVDRKDSLGWRYEARPYVGEHTLPEAQPERAGEANSHTHEYLLGYGEYRELVNEVERLTRAVERLTAVDAENRDNVTLALNGGAMDWSPDWPELIGVAGKIFDRWQERAAEARALTGERDAAVARAESAESALNILGQERDAALSKVAEFARELVTLDVVKQDRAQLREQREAWEAKERQLETERDEALAVPRMDSVAAQCWREVRAILDERTREGETVTDTLERIVSEAVEGQARFERSQAQTDDYERALESERRHTGLLTKERDEAVACLKDAVEDFYQERTDWVDRAGPLLGRKVSKGLIYQLRTELTEARAKLSEHEKEDAALRQLFGLSGLDVGDCATIDLAARLELQRVEARAQVAKLTEELATEHEQVSGYSQALNQFCRSLGIDPHCTTGPTDRSQQVAKKVGELLKRDGVRYDLEAMLWATRDEHTADEMLEEVARLQGDLSKTGVQRRQQLDEELQQIDDAIVAAGGEREAGPAAFIASQSAQISWLRDELTRAQHQAHTAINRDRTGLAGGLLHVKAIAQGYEWITEGHWGSYDHEQQTIETLRREVGDLIRGVVDGCMRYLRASGQRADEAARFKLEAKPARDERIATEAKIRGLVDQTWSLGAEIEEGHHLAAKLTAELAACMLVVDAARAWRAKAVPSSPRYDNAWWKLYDAVDALPVAVAVAGVEALEGKQS